MDYTAKSAVAEIISFIFIRLACLALCGLFFLPMFILNVSYENIWVVKDVLNIGSITGFQSLFGVKGTLITGNPFALAAFVYPLLIILISFIDLFYENFYKIALGSGILGLLLNFAYFVSETGYLSGKSGFFGKAYFEVKAMISIGCLLTVLIYLAIIGVSLLFVKMSGNKNT